MFAPIRQDDEGKTSVIQFRKLLVIWFGAPNIIFGQATRSTGAPGLPRMKKDGNRHRVTGDDGRCRRVPVPVSLDYVTVIEGHFRFIFFIYYDRQSRGFRV